MDKAPGELTINPGWTELPQTVPLSMIIDNTPSKSVNIVYSWKDKNPEVTVSATVANQVVLMEPFKEYSVTKREGNANGFSMTSSDGSTQDIPFNFFEALAANPTDLQIQIKNSKGVDFFQLIDTAQKKLGEINAFQKMRTFLKDYPIEQVEQLIQRTEPNSKFKLEPGNSQVNVVLREAGFFVVDKYMNSYRKGEEVDLDKIMVESIISYYNGVLDLAEKRPGQLIKIINNSNSMAVAFDYIGGNAEGVERQTVLTIYRPEHGWTVIAPTGACPSVAQSYLIRFFTGKLLEEDYNSTFEKSTQELVKSGVIEYDDKNRVLIFKDMSRINPTQAVFHSRDNDVNMAIETLSVAGDPIQGERYFHDILFKALPDDI